MKKLFYKVVTFYRTISSKIAFYPTLIAFGGLILAFSMIFVESKGTSQKMLDIFPQLAIENGDTALSIINVCIGGLISLMVFSFSMVMLLLSQASSNYSPRLLPGLISDKKHQIILGIYLGTIIYNIFTLFSIEPSEEKYSLPGLSILLGIAATIFCLALFIYFIHNISQSIQINNILENIYDKAVHKLEQIIENETDNQALINLDFPDTRNWHSYTSTKTGYYQNVSISNLKRLAVKHQFKLYITIPKGLFILQNMPLIKSSEKLDKEVVEEIISNFSFARGELIEDNYVLAFKEITEIAVKAMSPGINDPGTAINAIDYLTELFALRMQKQDRTIIIDDNEAVVKLAIVQFKDLMYNVMSSLRTYCKHDPIIVQKMIWMLNYLKHLPNSLADYYTTIDRELATLLSDADSSLESQRDKDQMIALNNSFKTESFKFS